MKPSATATYTDCYAGDVPAELVAFKTKRRGETVTRWRWTSRVTNTGGFAGSFKTPSDGIRAAERHACFRDVRSNSII